VLLFLMARLLQAFWRGPLNGLLLSLTALSVLWPGSRVASPRSWLLLQLILLPFLMALEEFLHTVVFVRKGLPLARLDLVTVYRVSRKGFKWFCYGAAIRWCGPLAPRDRIHISAPGPLMNLILAAALWSVCSLAAGGVPAGGLHVTFAPLLGYLLSSLVPLPAPIPNDMYNIMRAGREAGYDWRQTVRICSQSLSLLLIPEGRPGR
jgi:hypothetical protein